VNGHAFSNFERSTVVLKNIPGVTQDAPLGTEIADASENWRIADSTHNRESIPCSAAQLGQLVTVQATASKQERSQQRLSPARSSAATPTTRAASTESVTRVRRRPGSCCAARPCGTRLSRQARRERSHRALPSSQPVQDRLAPRSGRAGTHSFSGRGETRAVVSMQSEKSEHRTDAHQPFHEQLLLP